MARPVRLRGLRIVVTRPEAQAGGLARALQAEGAVAVLLPTAEIRVAADLNALDDALNRLEAYDWVVFTSANAVAITWERMEHADIPRERLAGRQLAAIGPATAAALAARGVQPAYVPPEYVGESLAEGLGRLDGQHVLLPRAQGAREALPAALAGRGAMVDEIVIYRTEIPQPSSAGLDQLRQGVDAVTFTSPSTVNGFIHVVRRAGLDPLALPGNPRSACIGPITAEAARRNGLRPDIQATSYTSEGLVQALIGYFQQDVPV